ACPSAVDPRIQQNSDPALASRLSCTTELTSTPGAPRTSGSPAPSDPARPARRSCSRTRPPYPLGDVSGPRLPAAVVDPTFELDAAAPTADGRSAASAAAGASQVSPVANAAARAWLYCVLPGSSGATSFRVRANCITSENTGPAAAPPYCVVGS